MSNALIAPPPPLPLRFPLSATSALDLVLSLDLPEAHRLWVVEKKNFYWGCVKSNRTFIKHKFNGKVGGLRNYNGRDFYLIISFVLLASFFHFSVPPFFLPSLRFHVFPPRNNQLPEGLAAHVSHAGRREDSIYLFLQTRN